MVAVVDKIRGVWSENTWQSTTATSWSVGEATTENSVSHGDRGVLVAHVCCVCSSVCVVWLEVLDLIWIIVDGVVLYIEKFSRRFFVLVFKGIVFVTMG